MRTLDSIRLLSVVTPVYNESEGIEEFLRGVRGVIDSLALNSRAEIVLVDDGSTDGSAEKLDVLAASSNGLIRVVHLSRNFGFCAASSAALRHSKGDVVILMDSDMQDDPSVFAEFLEKWREGCDVVYAVRTHRKDSSIVRALTWSFYRALRFTSSLPLPLDAGTFALMDRRVVDEINALPERNRYLPGLRCWIGFRQIGVSVERKSRRHGPPRMTLRRLWDMGMMAFFSFSFMPLFVFRLMGIAALFVAGIALCLCLVLWGAGAITGCWAAVLSLVAFLGGVNLFGVTIVCEYIGIVLDEVRQRPLYVVRRSSDSEDSE
jgi:dolichol-phosphate mannosyltransferase